MNINMKDLKNKTETDLVKQLKELRKDLEGFVANVLQKNEKNVKKGMFLRRNIARIKTVLNERSKSDA